jgi:molybdopterin synthase catalytic subunit
VEPDDARPGSGDTWVALTTESLSIGPVADWAVLPDCGAVVAFSGTVRDHAEGRPGVTHIVYEAYEAQVVPRLQAIADAARSLWPDVGRIAVLHRTGDLGLGEPSVVVEARAPHRAAAFAAARFSNDSLTATVPSWKRETWSGGEDWGLAATDNTEIDAGAGPSA